MVHPNPPGPGPDVDSSDAVDAAYSSLPPGVIRTRTPAPDPHPAATAPAPAEPPAPAPGPGPGPSAAEPTGLPSGRATAPAPDTARMPPAPVAEVPVSAPTPRLAGADPALDPRRDTALPPAPAHAAHTGAPVLPGTAAPAAAPVAPPALGAPWHSGARGPSYPAEPRELPRVRRGLDGAVLTDMVVDGATEGAVTIRAASVRGDSHRWAGEPRQDALCLARLGGDTPQDALLLLAVADGVGSARFSHVGSHTACRDLAGLLDPYAGQLVQAIRDGAENALTALVSSAIGRAAEALDRLAAHWGEQPNAFATTLRALLVPVDPAVRHRGFFAVGDGGLALLRQGVWHLDPAGEATGPTPDPTGVIDTRTAALPTARHAEARVLGPVAPGDLHVLSTDGFSLPLAGEAQMRDFLRAAWGTEAAALPAPADFLWQSQFRVKSYDDDRTVVCLWEDAP